MDNLESNLKDETVPTTKDIIVLSTMRAPQEIVHQTVAGINELMPDSTIIISMNDRSGENYWHNNSDVAAEIGSNVHVNVTTTSDYSPRQENINVTHINSEGGERSAYIYLNGFLHGLELGGERFFEMDMGGTMDWHDIPRFAKALSEGYDTAFSTRSASAGGQLVNSSFQRQLLSRGGTYLSNGLLRLGSYASDMTSGFEAFDRNVLREIFQILPPEEWLCIQYDAAHLYQTEMRAYCHWLGYNIAWVPITFGLNKSSQTIRDWNYLFRNLKGFLVLTKSKEKFTRDNL